MKRLKAVLMSALWLFLWSCGDDGETPIDNPPVKEKQHYTITVSPQPVGGSIVLDPAQGPYEEGTLVTVVALESEGIEFSRWSGDLAGVVEKTTTVTMDSHKVFSAEFGEPVSITVAPVPQGGSVVVTPDLERYVTGMQVTIEAVPDTNHNFSGWQGDLAAEADNPLIITLTEDLTFSAAFEPLLYTISVTPPPQHGGVHISPLQERYADGASVTITAVPDDGYGFLQWSGAADGATEPAIILVMDGDKELSATFEMLQRQWVASGNVTPSALAFENGLLSMTVNNVSLAGYRSFDDGCSWESDPPLGEEGQALHNQSALALHDGVEHVVYTADDGVFYLTHTAAAGWSSPVSINSAVLPPVQQKPDIVVTPAAVHVAYVELNDWMWGSNNIHVASSGDGATWHDRVVGIGREPTIDASSDSLHLCYTADVLDAQSEHTGAHRLECLRSFDGGQQWLSTTVRSGTRAFHPELKTADGVLYLAYQDYDFGAGEFEQYLKRSHDKGETWSSAKRVTSRYVKEHVSMVIREQHVYLTYHEDYDFDAQVTTGIYLTHSADWGDTWDEGRRLDTACLQTSENGCICSSSSAMAMSAAELFILYNTPYRGLFIERMPLE